MGEEKKQRELEEKRAKERAREERLIAEVNAKKEKKARALVEAEEKAKKMIEDKLEKQREKEASLKAALDAERDAKLQVQKEANEHAQKVVQEELARKRKRDEAQQLIAEAHAKRIEELRLRLEFERVEKSEIHDQMHQLDK